MCRMGKSSAVKQKLCNRYRCNGRQHNRELQQTEPGSMSRAGTGLSKPLLAPHRDARQDSTIQQLPLSLSPHCSHLLLIFRLVKWPLLCCLQVSGALHAQQFISLARMPLATLFMPFMLCKEAASKRRIYSCQALLLLLMLQSYCAATRSLCGPVFKSTQSPDNKSQARSGCSCPLVCPHFHLQNIPIQIINTEAEADSLLVKLHQCGCTGDEEAKWAIALHGLSQLNQSHH